VSRWRRDTKRSRPDDRSVTKSDLLEGGFHLADAGPVGVAIALVGGAIAVVVGVFTFMDRRS